jgi:hypothetical protein
MAIKEKNFNTGDICPCMGGSGECHSTPSKNKIKIYLVVFGLILCIN